MNNDMELQNDSNFNFTFEIYPNQYMVFDPYAEPFLVNLNSDDDSRIIENHKNKDNINSIIDKADEDNQPPKQNKKDNVNIKINYNEQNKIIPPQIIPYSNHKNPKKNNKTSDIKEANDTTNPCSNKKFNLKTEKKRKTNKKNLKKKVKKILINAMIIYVNDIIMKVYGGKIGEGVINKKTIKKIDPSESENITIAHNRKLLKKSIKEILSTKISRKYTSVIIPNINEKIINDLLNEENEEKRKIFINLFNKTFLDWILMLSDPKGELKDFYEKVLSKNNKRDENEINEISYMIKNFEKEFLNHKSEI